VPFVQEYLRAFGSRKCEANALVTRPKAGRQLCRDAIQRYVAEDAPEHYHARLGPIREQVRVQIVRLLTEGRTP
jgi:hypothetical protein